MTRKLSDIRLEIMTGNLSNKDWLRLDQEVDEAITQATESEIQEFVDSGAGEILDMTCSAIREIQKRN